MNDYSAWDEQTVSVTSLLLDPSNPRIPELGHKANQREIVAELVNNDAVYELAKDIAAQGFFHDSKAENRNSLKPGLADGS